MENNHICQHLKIIKGKGMFIILYKVTLNFLI